MASTTNLKISPDALIDLQTHTFLSDGKWSPEDLVDYFIAEGFALAAITDHDRVDTAPILQALSLEKNFPLLVAVEMTTRWRDDLITDILCFGFNLDCSPLRELAEDLKFRQEENARLVYDNLVQAGHIPQYDPDELQRLTDAPVAQYTNEMVDLLTKYHQDDKDFSLGRALGHAGFSFETNDTAKVVEAAHACGAIAIIAHPGRSDGFLQFDETILDEFRQEIPIDGIEVYYPLHSEEQVAMFQVYADQHGLLVSAGSDSHDAKKPPIKYRAELARKLLERLGVRFE